MKCELLLRHLLSRQIGDKPRRCRTCANVAILRIAANVKLRNSAFAFLQENFSKIKTLTSPTPHAPLLLASQFCQCYCRPAAQGKACNTRETGSRMQMDAAEN
jgi:hypothetical protein